MKVWTSEHVYDHPWHTVVNAAYRKYPNPFNLSVTAVDVVQQNIDQGILKTERIMQSQFFVPSWAAKLTGFSGQQYSREYTEIDPISRRMVLFTRNLNCSGFLRVDERLVYKPHESDREKTVLKQEMSVEVDLPAFTGYCEQSFLNSYQSNAEKGRKGMEWVIDQMKLGAREYAGITSKVSSEVHDLSDKLLSCTNAFSSAKSSK